MNHSLFSFAISYSLMKVLKTETLNCKILKLIKKTFLCHPKQSSKSCTLIKKISENFVVDFKNYFYLKIDNFETQSELLTITVTL